MDFLCEPPTGNPVDPIDLYIFKEHIRLSLLQILDSLPADEKTLVLEKNCISKLNYLTTLQPLQERKIRKELVVLGPKPFVTDCKVIVYIVPANRECVKCIETQIKSNLNSLSYGDKSRVGKDTEKQYHIIFIPKINNECQNAIKDSEYRAYFNIHNLNIDIFSLDYDLMSLEDHEAFKDLYILDNLNSLSQLSRSIIKYETVFGKIKYKYIKGDLAKKLNTILTKEEEISSLENDSETLACFIFDRKVDMITPFCTQFTYEGLLDEYIGINFNSIKVSPKILEKDTKVESIKVDLSNADKFYNMIKDYNFNKISNFLPSRLQAHSKVLEEGKKLTDLKKIQENLEKVKLVKDERTSLTNHINLADFIAQRQKLPITRMYLQMEQSLLVGGELPNNFRTFIDDEIGKKTNEFGLLRILCLESLVRSGIKSKILDQIKRDFFNTYGYQEIFLWKNLEKVGIIRNSDSTFDYDDINKKLNLIYENVNINEPNDPAYAFSGYCPITIRLIEKACTNGWGSIKDTLRKIPGTSDFPTDESEVIDQNSEKQFFLLVFIGGITYGEIGAIRYLNKKFRNKKFIILTTGTINSNKILESLRLRPGVFFPKILSETTQGASKIGNFGVNNKEESYLTYKEFAEGIK